MIVQCEAVECVHGLMMVGISGAPAALKSPADFWCASLVEISAGCIIYLTLSELCSTKITFSSISLSLQACREQCRALALGCVRSTAAAAELMILRHESCRRCMSVWYLTGSGLTS